MTFKPWAVACLLGLCFSAWAQRDLDLIDWKEVEVPPPPAFDVGKLLTFDVGSGSSLEFGVDPATLHISSDGVLRYVMVATGTGGARNVLYEGLRCTTGEYKTYARHSPEGGWKPIAGTEWRSVFGYQPAQYTLAFARAGACDNAAQASSVAEIVRQLKAGKYRR